MINKNNDSPFLLKISFNKLLQEYERLLTSDDAFLAAKAKRILEAQAPYPLLREGFSDPSLLEKYREPIHTILEDIFSEVLTKNEIKAASIPFENVIIHSSRRFKNIVSDAGTDFDLSMNLSDDARYIMGCVVILAMHYGYDIDLRRPLYYDIPDADGKMKHYRIMYNADLTEILTTKDTRPITQDDVDELLDNFNNIDLWKEKFPPQSYIFKGFVIANMFDVTLDSSISDLKSTLLGGADKEKEDSIHDFEKIFQAIFNVEDLKVGFAGYDASQQIFERIPAKNVNSFILNEKYQQKCDTSLCEDSYQKLFDDKEYFAVSDIDKYYELSKGAAPYKAFKEQGIKSVILAPITSDGEMLGILELVSKQPKVLNSINANKLDDVMPYIITAVHRSKMEEENQLEAIIQQECTSIHNTVYWKFEEEAKRFLKNKLEGHPTSFQEIVFKDVYPLYGQIDIKDSSQARNDAIQRDLMIQLSHLNAILEEAIQLQHLPVYEQIQFRLQEHLNDIKIELQTYTEQLVLDFIKEEIHPILDLVRKQSDVIEQLVVDYEKAIANSTNSVYDHRKNYDESVTLINKRIARVIDKSQEDAQAMFPHYFERYKTDGVEHNMYIGASMVQGIEFHDMYLKNLRLWQLQVMCDMENAYYNFKPELPIKLDVASMLLVYSAPLSIRFRMDEKQFDIDGTYNARYEIIKKRLDKSLIKGTNERLTQKGKIAIVYSQKKDEQEYLRYISFLQSKNYFTSNVEIVELGGLQGVSGLKAIRVEVLYNKGSETERHYTYQDLMEELNL